MCTVICPPQRSHIDHADSDWYRKAEDLLAEVRHSLRDYCICHRDVLRRKHKHRSGGWLQILICAGSPANAVERFVYISAVLQREKQNRKAIQTQQAATGPGVCSGSEA